MNPDFPTDPHLEREARLSALILGQLPPEQVAEVRQQLNQDPELLKLYQRLQLAAELIREAAATTDPAKSPAPLPRLSHQRRERVLASFKTITPDTRTRSQWSFKSWAVPAAAAAMILVLGAGLLPSLSRAKREPQKVTALPSGYSASLESEQIPLTTDHLDSVLLSSSDASISPPPALALADASGLPNALEPSAAVASAAPDAEARGRLMMSYGLSSGSPQTPSTSAGRREATAAGGMSGGAPAKQSEPATSQVLAKRLLERQDNREAAVEKAPAQALYRNSGDGRFNKTALTKVEPTTPTPAPVLGNTPVVYWFQTNSGPTTDKGNALEPVIASAADSSAIDFAVNTPTVESLQRGLSVGLGANENVGQWAASRTDYNLDGELSLGERVSSATTAQNGVVARSRLYANTPANGSMQGTWADYDDDGFLDLFVANNVGGRSIAMESRQLAESNRSSLEAGVALKKESGKVLSQELDKYYAKSHPDDAKKSKMAANGPVENQLGKATQLVQLSEGKIKSLESMAKLDREALQTDAPAAQPAPPAPVPQPEFLTRANRFSTFSMNVSDVSFKLAAAALEKGVMPEAGTIRSEEFINAFDYHDPEPAAGAPIAFAWEIARSPFAHNRDLIRFSVKTAAQGRQPGRPLNIVVLLDNSGSMERADRARIIQNAFRSLVTQLQAQDKLSVVLFARTAQLWVDGVAGDQAANLADGISSLVPQGGTNLEEAMNLAYQTVVRHYAATGINRVVLLTDGAANLGDVEPTALKEKVESFRKQGIALDCFGIGWEGYNDELMENLSRNGDGRYGFLNTPEEAESGFVSQLAGALRVAASDVKVQVEFNPDRINLYRQIGYAKHQLTKEQFRDNTVDAAEIGAAESGNALYSIEMNPSGMGPIATLRVRYKVPGTTEYKELEWLVPYQGNSPALEQASPAMRLAITASAFSEWLASNPHAGDVTTAGLLKACEGVPQAFSSDARPKQLEWMIRQAQSLSGK